MEEMKRNDSSLWESLKSIATSIDNLLDQLVAGLGHRMKYQEFTELSSQSIDKKIIAECREKQLVCYGGKAKVGMATFYTKKQEALDCVVMVVEVYYKDINGGWVKSEFKSKTPVTRFDLDDEATSCQLGAFKNRATEEIEIDPPKM